MIMDGSKEQTFSSFHKKLCKMGCDICQTEPDPPWQNAAEGAICKVKHGASQEEIPTQGMGPLLGVGPLYSIKHGIELL